MIQENYIQGAATCILKLMINVDTSTIITHYLRQDIKQHPYFLILVGGW